MTDVTKLLGILNTGLDGRDYLLGEVRQSLDANSATIVRPRHRPDARLVVLIRAY